MGHTFHLCFTLLTRGLTAEPVVVAMIGACIAAGEEYFGEARLKDGRLVQREHHRARFDESARIHTAGTACRNPMGGIKGGWRRVSPRTA